MRRRIPTLCLIYLKKPVCLVRLASVTLHITVVCLALQGKVEEVEHALYGAQRAKEEAAKRAALEERLAKRAAEREKIDKAKDWSEEEVRMLEKAIDKFPSVHFSFLAVPSFSFVDVRRCPGHKGS